MGRLDFPHNGLPLLEDVTTLAGDENTSIFQPEFSPDGRYLTYVSDQSGWWQLYLHDLSNADTRQLTHDEAEHGEPGWVQGMRTYGFAPDGRSLYFIRMQMGRAGLWRVELPSGRLEQINLPREYTWLIQISVSPKDGQVSLLATGGRTPTRLIVYQPSSGETKVVCRPDAGDLPETTFSMPQAISWQGLDGGEAHGILYLPHSESFEGAGKPPLIVEVHGGPTSQRNLGFDLEAQFFTSRGYAVLQPNHRGSSGYGREYRNKLRGNWGIYDVQDSVSGARHLAKQGLVDGSKLVIMGGSAGGFTVLKALEEYPGFFKAGIDLYGVSDQFDFIVGSTHKFEEHYNDRLLGPYPEAAGVYKERSPLFFVDQIQDPIAIFQGEDDIVVPRRHSDEVVKSLQQRGVPQVYHVYPGEGHGFSKPETIEHYYTEVEKFLRQYVILT
jgi:dipeptidyl aminopeptidase/acylaminoacyl peptidase